MLTVIVILLVLNTLLNLAVGFLNIIVLGELDASKKYRFEFESIISSDLVKHDGVRTRNAAQKQFH